MYFKFHAKLVLILLVNISNAQNHEELQNILKIFGNIYQNIFHRNSVTVPVLKINEPPSDTEDYSEFNDTLCRIQTEAFYSGLQIGEEWAFKS